MPSARGKLRCVRRTAWRALAPAAMSRPSRLPSSITLREQIRRPSSSVAHEVERPRPIQHQRRRSGCGCVSARVASCAAADSAATPVHAMHVLVVPRPSLDAKPSKSFQNPIADSARPRWSEPQSPLHPADSPAPEAASTPSARASPRDRLAAPADYALAPVPSEPRFTDGFIAFVQDILMAAFSSASPHTSVSA